MDAPALAAFAAAIFVLFFTPGPGNAAMVARTLDRGPAYGVTYGLGILTGDVVWLTVAITGLAAAAELADGWTWLAKAAGAGVLIWFAVGAFHRFARPAATAAPLRPPTRLGLAATYAAGVAMPMSNPKAIVFYLSFLPAFFDLSAVTPASYVAMILIMLAMFGLFALAYVGLAHRARDWIATRGFRRWTDLATGLVMVAVAIVLLVR